MYIQCVREYDSTFKLGYKKSSKYIEINSQLDIWNKTGFKSLRFCEALHTWPGKQATAKSNTEHLSDYSFKARKCKYA
jgi:hypothetical protein